MRIATWNVNSIGARLPRLLEWLQTREPDVACLQELKCTEDAFPFMPLQALGYEAAVTADGRWNGVAVLSRIGLDQVRRGLDDEPGFPEPESRAVAATCAGVRVRSVYVPNGRTPEDPHYAYKLAWLDALRSTLLTELDTFPASIVLGDFNVAPTDTDVWDAAAFLGATHVTEAERTRLAALRDLGLTDVMPRPGKGPNPFTYWDYRGGSFHKDLGMRIDHVYAAPVITARVQDAWVDRDSRKGKGPSDHAPVIVDLTDPR